MKKLILILSVVLISCSYKDKYEKRAPTHADICIELLNQRDNERYYQYIEAVRSIDSMFMKCGCDTLK